MLIKIGRRDTVKRILSSWYFCLTGEAVDFTTGAARPNTVLLVELNGFHGECIPGFYKYLTELNYDVDVLVHRKVYNEKTLDLIHSENVYHGSLILMSLLLQYVLIDLYPVIIFNSNTIHKGKWCTTLQEYPFLYDYLDKLYVMEHYVEYLEPVLLEMGHAFVLTNKELR